MMVRSLIRVLVIDDSAFSRQAITRMLEASPLVEVVGVARDGEDALRKTFELQPDLITVDLEMPRMDGFTFLRVVMSQAPDAGDRDQRSDRGWRRIPRPSSLVPSTLWASRALVRRRSSTTSSKSCFGRCTRFAI